jgi:uncharacterized protein (UPF0332 family)
LQSHEATPEELAKLRTLAEHRLLAAQSTALFTDLRFMAAYDAARSLAKMVLAVAGWRVTGYGQHFTTFHALPAVMGESYRALSAYSNDCREKRNVAEYDEADTIAQSEVDELIEAATEFRSQVESWITAIRPDLSADVS